jgi:predicted lipid-binding transport protein (Tim44 family)
MGAGILTAASAVPLVGGLAQLLLNLSGIALLGGGIWTIFRVIRNRK